MLTVTRISPDNSEMESHMREEAFVDAARHGKLEVVKRILKEMPPGFINEATSVGNGDTAILAAAFKGHADVLRHLGGHPQINWNAQIDDHGNNIFHIVAEHHSSKSEVFQYVRQHVPETKDFNWTSGNSRTKTTPLHLAAHPTQTDLQMVKTILSMQTRKLQITDQDQCGNTALHLACRSQFLSRVKCLVKHHQIAQDKLADESEKFDLLNCTNDMHETPLHLACESFKMLPTVKFLLSQPDIDVNAKTKLTGSTALHIAASSRRLRIVKELVEHPRIDMYARDKNGRTPFDVAKTKKVKDYLEHMQWVKVGHMANHLSQDLSFRINAAPRSPSSRRLDTMARAFQVVSCWVDLDDEERRKRRQQQEAPNRKRQKTGA